MFVHLVGSMLCFDSYRVIFIFVNILSNHSLLVNCEPDPTFFNNTVNLAYNLQYFLIGEWNEWSNWSECSQTCGGGQRVRKRSLKYTPKEHPGFGPGFGFQSVISCDNSLSSRIQFDACNKNYCPGTQGPTNVTIHEPSSRAAIPSMI